MLSYNFEESIKNLINKQDFSQITQLVKNGEIIKEKLFYQLALSNNASFIKELVLKYPTILTSSVIQSIVTASRKVNNSELIKEYCPVQKSLEEALEKDFGEFKTMLGDNPFIIPDQVFQTDNDILLKKLLKVCKMTKDWFKTACQFGAINCQKLLWNNGFKQTDDIRDVKMWTFLYENGEELGSTPFHNAIKWDNYSLFEWAIDNEVQIDTKSIKLAIQFDRKEMFNHFIKQDVKLDGCLNYIDFASKNAHYYFIACIVKMKQEGNIFITNQIGTKIVEQGNFLCLKFIIEDLEFWSRNLLNRAILSNNLIILSYLWNKGYKFVQEDQIPQSGDKQVNIFILNHMEFENKIILKNVLQYFENNSELVNQSVEYRPLYMNKEKINEKLYPNLSKRLN